MLKQRIITALILAVLVSAAIYYLPNKLFGALALGFIVGLAGVEWQDLVYQIRGADAGSSWYRRSELTPLLMFFSLSIVYFQPPLLPILFLAVVVWCGLIFLLFNYMPGTKRYTRYPYMLSGAALFVLIPAWYALTELHAIHYGYVFYIIALVAVADIGAYFAGKRFGKTKLAPNLSPGKTREGVYGALALTFVWAILGTLISGHGGMDAVLFILFSMLAVVMSVLGDLFESLIKREAGAKDSGTLLPGHGGVLDRIDGLLAALPVFTLGLLWIKAG